MNATLVQRAVALIGFAAVCWAAVQLPGRGVSQPGWVWPVFVGWSIGVPYWHYLEYRLFAPADEDARRRFLELQGLSRAVWLGGVAVLGVAALR